ncbi:MAG: hypothetical protein A2798_00870 [Candidatus Levybacteria bacterium RIFCSPHIGHO2_01_FULL_37_17]|nr:MAG: hypothetical protein A2798_00870 [Candidatus Levybacteria bacterium RIFCSPHIGHO2_01_FULL_37_17]OGH37003.1 MAG: hypothetical protein A2959_01730 [Candidatus Levybacteria bacterium RIFCSPLOWO2_01_FULL_38_23]
MPNKFGSINLVKSDKGETVERVINWLLSIGRILVIVTELVALGAFLWRFGLDQQLIDLHSKIKQKQAIVEAFKKNEEEYRNLQDRLSIAASFADSSQKKLNVYSEILQLAPEGIAFTQLSKSSNTLSMEMNVNSVSALSSFVAALKSNPNIESISIDKIETKTNKAVILVGISAEIKAIQNKYATQIQ